MIVEAMRTYPLVDDALSAELDARVDDGLVQVRSTDAGTTVRLRFAT